MVLPFWYRLTWVVAEKGLLNGSVRVTLAFSSTVLSTLSPYLFTANIGTNYCFSKHLQQTIHVHLYYSHSSSNLKKVFKEKCKA